MFHYCLVDWDTRLSRNDNTGASIAPKYPPVCNTFFLAFNDSHWVDRMRKNFSTDVIFSTDADWRVQAFNTFFEHSHMQLTSWASHLDSRVRSCAGRNIASPGVASPLVHSFRRLWGLLSYWSFTDVDVRLFSQKHFGLKMIGIFSFQFWDPANK